MKVLVTTTVALLVLVLAALIVLGVIQGCAFEDHDTKQIVSIIGGLWAGWLAASVGRITWYWAEERWP